MKIIKYIVIAIILCVVSYYLGYHTGSEKLDDFHRKVLEEENASDTTAIEIDSIPNNIKIIHNKEIFSPNGNTKNVIPNEKVALSVFMPIARAIYGNELISKEEPFNIKLEDDSVWNITGTNRYQAGGVIHFKMLSTNGKVIEIYHDK